VEYLGSLAVRDTQRGATVLGVIEGLVFLSVVLIAFRYFGDLLLRWLLPTFARDDPGLAVAFATCAFLACCGILEITSLASRATLIAPIAICVAGWAVTGAINKKGFNDYRWLPSLIREDGRAVALLGAFVLLLALFLVNTADWTYGFVDDRQGYLVFPERILSEGSIGRDPFEYRRIESGLSANGAYLYALFRSALDLRQTRLADVGLGGVSLLLLVGRHAREVQASLSQFGIILLVTLCVIAFSPLINNSPDTVAKALLYALLRITMASAEAPLSLRRGGAFGIVTFGLIALKTSYVPAASAVLLAFYASTALKRFSLRLCLEIVVAGSVALVLMIPWMIVSTQIAGTMLYPLLGLGTLRPEETGSFASGWSYATQAGRLFVLLTPSMLVSWVAWHASELRPQRLLLLLLVVFSSIFVLLAQVKFTVFGYRYGEMGPSTLLLFFLVIGLGCQLGGLQRLTFSGLLGLSLVIVIASKATNRIWLDNGALAQALAGPGQHEASDWRDDRRLQYQAMQRAVPAGLPLLVVLSWPSLLDFHRNAVMVMDWPAMMGPPGMPVPDDPRGWSIYLARNHICYVAYDYREEAGYPHGRIAHDLAEASQPYSYSLFELTLAKRTGQMHETVLALRGFGRTIYDDGQRFVIQLNDCTADAER
jgi:hypothetical protein